MNAFMSLLRQLMAGLVISLTLVTLARADDLDMTWRLVMRKLPDGTVQTPPTVQGMSTFKNGVNQLIVFWPAPDGKPASLSEISKWEWSATEVAVTPTLVIFDDGSGKGPVYAVGGERKIAAVIRQGNRISYQHPIDPPYVVRDGDRMTATLAGVFVDYWERVK